MSGLWLGAAILTVIVGLFGMTVGAWGSTSVPSDFVYQDAGVRE